MGHSTVKIPSGFISWIHRSPHVPGGGQQDGRILWRISQLRHAEHGWPVLWLSEPRGVAWAAACDESDDDDELNLRVNALDALGACCGVQEGMRALGCVLRRRGCSSALATPCDS